MINLKSELIKASAGTGKTYKLSLRYIAHLLDGEQVSRILATTFTKKAAGEIIERIYQILVKGSKNENIIKELDLTPEKSLKLLKKISSEQHKIKIITLDAFFNQILMFFTTQLGLSKSYEILDNESYAKRTTKIVDTIFEKLSSNESLNILTEFYNDRLPINFRREITDNIKKYSEVFGINRKKNWIKINEELVVDWKLILTDLVENTKDNLGISAKKIPILIENIQNNNIKEIFNDKTIIDNAIKVVINNETIYAKKEISQAGIRIAKNILQNYKSSLINALNRKNSSLAEIFELQKDITDEVIKKSGKLSFFDIKQKLFENSILGNLDLLYFRLDSRINHVLLDEFQDTSVLDWEIISPLIEEIVFDPSRSIFVVGDQKQAIYGWRGGTSELFNHIEQRYSNIISTSLNETYRCSQIILDFVNDFFFGLNNTKLNLEFKNVVEAWNIKFEKQISKRDLPGVVKLIDSSEESATQIADLIKELINKHENLSIGVLVRSNNDLNELKAKLNHRDYQIDYTDEAGVEIYNDDLIIAILAFFEWCDHPNKTVCKYIFETSQIYSNDPNLQKQVRNKVFKEGYISAIQYLIKESKLNLKYEQKLVLEKLYNLAGAYSRNSSRLSDFVEYIKTKKIPNQTNCKVSLMTIHKSKGLEFDIVILPEFDDKLLDERFIKIINNQSEKLLIDKFSLRKDKNHTLVIQEISDLSKSTFEKIVDEQLSVMYVAFTRAKQALYITGKFNDQSLTASGLIKQAGCHSLYGNENFIIETKSENSIYKNYPNKVKIEISDSWTKSLPIKNPSKENKKQFFSTGVTRGTALHRILQDIIFWDGKIKVKYPTNYKKYVDELEEILNQSNFEFLKEQKCKVYNEFSFSIRSKDSITVGSIDRLIVFDDRIEIYDYKSDQGVISDELIEKYSEQLNLYSSAIKQIFKKENIKKFLVILENKQVIELNN